MTAAGPGQARGDDGDGDGDGDGGDGGARGEAPAAAAPGRPADPLEAALAPADLAMLDELADALVRRHLGTPALFFLESMRPLGFVGSQLMLVVRPLVALAWPDPRRWDQVQRVLEVRGATELLCRRLEARL